MSSTSRSKCWCFTVNAPTDADVAAINSLKLFANYLVYQKEKVALTHFQGYVQFKKQLRFNAVKSLLPRAHLEPSLKANAAAAAAYCKKAESREDGPWEFGTLQAASPGKRSDLAAFVEAVSTSTLTEEQLLFEHADVLAKYPRYVDRMLKFQKEKNIEIAPLVPQAVWQTELVDYLATPPDARKVRWYVDVLGNTGKSHFARHYSVQEKYIVTGGRFADVYYAYSYEPVVFFDFARTKEEAVPWEVLENFKNGYFLSTKYEVKRMIFNTPHVICFSNFHPDQSKLSLDRWDIVVIN